MLYKPTCHFTAKPISTELQKHFKSPMSHTMAVIFTHTVVINLQSNIHKYIKLINYYCKCDKHIYNVQIQPNKFNQQLQHLRIQVSIHALIIIFIFFLSTRIKQ